MAGIRNRADIILQIKLLYGKNYYSESQIYEYIARAHKMSSSTFILKYMTAVMLPHWSAQKESCLDVRSFIRFMKIYPNIIVASHLFDNFLRNCFF